MPVVAHISDLHFGRTDTTVVEALLGDLARQRPDLVIVSGDLTQRARTRQFAEARDFLDRLPAPALVVPGNHDIAPLYRPLNRLFRPRAKFERHLPGHADWPLWHDDKLVAVGLDSTRPCAGKAGSCAPGTWSGSRRCLPPPRPRPARWPSCTIRPVPPRPDTLTTRWPSAAST